MCFETSAFGTFSFHPLAIADYQFLTALDRVPFEKTSAFVAQPRRALMDLVALRNERWSGIERSEEHTSEIQSLMRISYEVFCLPTKTTHVHARIDLNGD